MTDGLVWILVSVEWPGDNQEVYARVKYGLAHKVTFFTWPKARWEGGSIVYDLDYFSEWAALPGDGVQQVAAVRPVKRSR